MMLDVTDRPAERRHVADALALRCAIAATVLGGTGMTCKECTDQRSALIIARARSASRVTAPYERKRKNAQQQ
jgi:hypothetical protein